MVGIWKETLGFWNHAALQGALASEAADSKVESGLSGIMRIGSKTDACGRCSLRKVELLLRLAHFALQFVESI